MAESQESLAAPETATDARSKWAGDALLSRAMYFGYFGSLGSLGPFITLYYKHVGLSAEQIGLLAAASVAISSTTVLIWGGIADTFRLHRAILRGALFVVPIAALIISQASVFSTLLIMIGIYAFLNTPILPLIDSAALEAAARRGMTYGGLRFWGSVGWIVATFLIGNVIQQFGLQWMFYSYAILLWLTFVLSWFQQARQQTLRAPVLTGLRDLLINRDFAIFMLCIFLVGLAASAAFQFFALYMQRIGAKEAMVGYTSSLAALAEAPAVGLSGLLLRRFKARNLLIIAFATYAVRWLILSFITNPVLALLSQLLHGLSFGLFLVAGVTYVQRRTPEGMSATAQSLYGLISYGLASIAGSLIGGYLFDRLELALYYRVLSLITVIGLVVFVIFRPRPESTNSKTAS